MHSANDFVIANDVLFPYIGKGGEIAVPACVKKIEKQAFEGCSQLSDLRLPKGIQYEQLISARIDAVSAYVMGNLDASEEILSNIRGLIKPRREKLMQKIVESDSEQTFVSFCDG